MKNYRYNILGALLILLVTVTSCKKDNPSSDERAKALQGVWTATSVVLNDVDVTEPTYTDFTITFREGGTYITSGGSPIFTNNGGFWEVTVFADNFWTLDVDGVTMNVTFSGETNATLAFTANNEVIGASNRIAGLVGSYEFTLQKQ